jgi:methylenetetrahydrofolate reductase (NADPH)
MNSLRHKLSQGEFVYTCEVTPPKGGDLREFSEMVSLLGPHVDALNVTDNNRAVMRLSSWAGCVEIRRQGFSPVLQVACRDRNRLAIQSDLLGCSALGIENVLCLTGDPVKVGDDPAARLVGELNSQTLLQAVRTLNEGRDLAGNALDHPTHLFAGAACHPTIAAPEKMARKILEKIEAGAVFFQTQAVYDLAAFERFMNWHAKFGGTSKVIAGIFVLRGPKNAAFVQKSVPGMIIPDEVIARLGSFQDTRRAGLELAAEHIRAMKSMCQGVHVMAVKQEEKIPELIAMTR